MLVLWLFCLILGAHCVDRSNFRTCSQSSFCTRQRKYNPSQPVFVVDDTTVSVHDNTAQAQVINPVSLKRLNLTITYHTGSTFRVVLDEANPIRPRFRPRIGDSLIKEPVLAKLEGSKTPTELTLRGPLAAKAVVTFNPFKVSFYKGEQLQLTLNDRDLLYFEPIPQGHDVQLEESEPEPINEKSVDEVKAFADSEHSQEDQLNDQENSIKESENGAEGPDHEVEKSEDSQKDPEPKEDGSEQPVEASTPQEPAPVNWSEDFKGHRDSRPHGPTSVGIDFTFHGYDYVYGIPEHADTFALRNTNHTDPYRLFNLDVFEYELNNPMALYGSVPLMWAHKKHGTVGVFVNNPTEGWVDVESANSGESGGLFAKLPNLFSTPEQAESAVKTRWMFETGVLDVFVILAESPREGVKAYADLTGTTPLPPLFALAHHQCRWNYKDETEMEQVNQKYDENVIPMDVLWLDIEHSDGKRYLTWDSSNFANPNVMVDKLAARGRKLVVVVDPHIKRDHSWNTFS